MRNRLALVIVLGTVLGAALWFSWGTPPSAAEALGPAAQAPPPSAGPARTALVPRPAAVLADRPPEDDEAALVLAQLKNRLVDAGSPDAADGTAGAAQVAAVHEWLRQNASAAEKHVNRFCAESKRLAPQGFSAPTRSRDAAVFLGNRVDWENGRVGLLHLPASLTQRMGNPPYSWRAFTPADYAGLDFGWLRELLAFDHWSLSGDGPLKDLDATDYFTAPVPNFVMLQNWVKLRLLKGLHENDAAQASLEVRHLADLCASSGTLLGEMIRVAMFGIERGFWEAFGLAPPEPLPSAGEGQQFRQAAFAGMYFLFPGVAREVRLKALACMPARCAGLTEAIGATSAMRDLLPDARGELEWLLAQHPCDPAQAARISRGKGQPVSTLAENYAFEGELPLRRWLKELLDGGL